MKTAIASAILFGVVGAGIAAYKAATTKEEKADILLLDKDSIKSVALDVFQREAAEGYRLAIFNEMPEALRKVVFGDNGVSSEGVSVKKAHLFAGLTDPSSRTIYIFVEGLLAERELRKKLGKKKSNVEIVCDTVLHECRHSRQFAAMEKEGMDLDKVFAYERGCGYGKGPMEADAHSYADFPKTYGFLIRPSLVAKSIKKRIDDPLFTLQYNIATAFGK